MRSATSSRVFSAARAKVFFSVLCTCECVCVRVICGYTHFMYSAKTYAQFTANRIRNAGTNDTTGLRTVSGCISSRPGQSHSLRAVFIEPKNHSLFRKMFRLQCTCCSMMPTTSDLRSVADLLSIVCSRSEWIPFTFVRSSPLVRRVRGRRVRSNHSSREYSTRAVEWNQ